MAHARPSTIGARTAPDGIDARTPHEARVLDYLLGGTANHECDRALVRPAPDGRAGPLDAARAEARAVRQAQRRIVRYLAGERGIRQFLDFGSGLPTMHNVHLAAGEATADARVVYLDNDPGVVRHAARLLPAADGRTVFLEADFHDPKDVLRRAAETLDLAEPVALTMFGILPCVADEDYPEEILAVLLDAVAQGSYLAFSHAAAAEGDEGGEESAQGSDTLDPGALGPGALGPDVLGSDALGPDVWDPVERCAGRIALRRTRAQAERFLDSLVVLDPGVVGAADWRPPAGRPVPRRPRTWVGVGLRR